MKVLQSKITGVIFVALLFILFTSISWLYQVRASEDATVTSFSSQLAEKIYPFGMYHGEDPDMLYRLSVFEAVVLDADSFSQEQIATLQQTGTTVYALLSIAAAEKGTHAYTQHPGARMGAVPHTRNSYYMNPANKKWRKFVMRSRLQQVKEKGVDGFYLTQADVYNHTKNKEQVAEGVLTILERLNKKYPTKKIIVEDPLELFASAAFSEFNLQQSIDGISKTMLNDRPSYTAEDGGRDTYQEQLPEKRKQWVKQLQSYAADNITIYTVDCTQTKSEKETAERRAARNGFVSFVGTRDLDNVLWYGGRTSSTATRPFTKESVWNTPISSDAAVDTNSTAMVDTLLDGWSLNRIFLNVTEWTIPIYYADSTTPRNAVTCTGGCGPGFPGSPGYEDAIIPIPDNATPDQTTDGLMTVVDVESGLSYDFYQAIKGDSGWNTTSGFRFDLTGNGIQEISSTSTSARGAGFPLMAGLIRRDEILQGVIPHALLIAIDYPKAGEFVWPASAEDGRSEEEFAIPEGARIQLNPNLNIDALGLNRTGRIIARALQQYGAFVGDNSDGLAIYVEGRYAKSPEWENDATGEEAMVTSEDITSIPLDELRVLELGEPLTNPYLE